MTGRARSLNYLAVEFTPIPHFQGGWLVELLIQQQNLTKSMCSDPKVHVSESLVLACAH